MYKRAMNTLLNIKYRPLIRDSKSTQLQYTGPITWFVYTTPVCRPCYIWFA